MAPPMLPVGPAALDTHGFATDSETVLRQVKPFSSNMSYHTRLTNPVKAEISQRKLFLRGREGRKLMGHLLAAAAAGIN